MTCFVTNYCIYNYLLSYSLFAHANTTFELHTLQIYAKYLYVSAKRGVNTQFDCANVCMTGHEDMFFRQEDMKTCFFRQEDMKTFISNKKMGGSHSLRTAHNI